jgi:hypothetical protein
MDRRPFDDAWIDLYAETCARLAVPFADRAAVLWRAGFDEPAWVKFDVDCVEAMQGDAGAGNCERFGRVFARVRSALQDASLPSIERPSEVAPTLERIERNAAGAAPLEPESTELELERAPPEPSVPLDVMQAMATLASSSGSPPSNKSGS